MKSYVDIESLKEILTTLVSLTITPHVYSPVITKNTVLLS